MFMHSRNTNQEGICAFAQLRDAPLEAAAIILCVPYARQEIARTVERIEIDTDCIEQPLPEVRLVKNRAKDRTGNRPRPKGEHGQFDRP